MAVTPPDEAEMQALDSNSRIAVLGAGRMGCGIAQIFCAAGHQVTLHDRQQAALERAPHTIGEMFELLQQPARLGGLRCVDELAAAVGQADLVIEAVIENVELKRSIFAQLESFAPAHCIFATNTSAIPIAAIARDLKAPERALGTHFWNPPHLVPLVEVVQGEKTDPENIRQVIALLEMVGMSPVHVRRDIPGFIGNRLQHAFKREAIALVADGVCDAETLDRVVKEGFGARLAVLGPLEQSDLVGLDLTLAIHEVLIADLDRHAGPHPYLVDKVRKGETGMKTGQGFRKWTEQEAAQVKERLDEYLAVNARARLARRDKPA